MNTRKWLYRWSWCLVVAIAAGLPCYAQQDERTLEKGSWRFEPVEVMGLKTKGQTREFGRKFMDEDDWLTGLTVVAKNISDQPIARIEFELSFPRAEGREFVSFIVYGKDPAAPNAAYVRQIQPGETVDVQIHPVNVPAIQAKLLGLGYPPKIKRAQMRLRSVTFADGTMWHGDLILSPDPQNPDRKINPREVTKPYPRKSRPQLSAIRGQDWASRRFHHMRFVSKNVLDAMSPSTPVFEGMCDKLFIRSEQRTCNTYIDPETGDDWPDGCKYAFDDMVPPFYTWTGNARAKTVEVACTGQEEFVCNPGPQTKSTTLRDTCGPQRTAGTCGGSSENGCMSGFTNLGGYCGRSYTFQQQCAGIGYDEETCSCPEGIETSPIIIDVDQSGFDLTNEWNGVAFNILNDGVPLDLSWTKRSSTNAFLVLDRSGNGTIDNGQELFGNFTPQPPAPNKNGFLALAEYDKQAAGGNRNGRIDRGDSIFTSLRLWQDMNHNGLSESNELRSLPSLNVHGIDLDFKESRRTDQYGNKLRYRAKVYDGRGSHTGRWAVDVFLLVG